MEQDQAPLGHHGSAEPLADVLAPQHSRAARQANSPQERRHGIDAVPRGTEKLWPLVLGRSGRQRGGHDRHGSRGGTRKRLDARAKATTAWGRGHGAGPDSGSQVRLLLRPPDVLIHRWLCEPHSADSWPGAPCGDELGPLIQREGVHLGPDQRVDLVRDLDGLGRDRVRRGRPLEQGIDFVRADRA